MADSGTSSPSAFHSARLPLSKILRLVRVLLAHERRDLGLDAEALLELEAGEGAQAEELVLFVVEEGGHVLVHVELLRLELGGPLRHALGKLLVDLVSPRC